MPKPLEVVTHLFQQTNNFGTKMAKDHLVRGGKFCHIASQPSIPPRHSSASRQPLMEWQPLTAWQRPHGITSQHGSPLTAAPSRHGSPSQYGSPSQDPLMAQQPLTAWQALTGGRLTCLGAWPVAEEGMWMPFSSFPD